MSFRFNPLTGSMDFINDLEISVSNGLSLSGNSLSLQLASPANSGAISPTDYQKINNLKFYKNNIETVILTFQQISDKKITLSKLPAFPDALSFIPTGGIAQKYGEDYTVVNNDIDWSGMGLDGFLEEGEEITISYQSE